MFQGKHKLLKINCFCNINVWSQNNLFIYMIIRSLLFVFVFFFHLDCFASSGAFGEIEGDSSFCCVRHSKGLTFVLEEITDVNYPAWLEFQENFDTDIGQMIATNPQFAQSISAAGHILSGILSAHHALSVESSDQLWVMYAFSYDPEEPVSPKPMADVLATNASGAEYFPHIELFCTVSKSRDIPLIGHMGIVRNPSHILHAETMNIPKHPRLSTMLHGFSAYVLKSFFDVEYVVTNPVGKMADILKDQCGAIIGRPLLDGRAEDCSNNFYDDRSYPIKAKPRQDGLAVSQLFSTPRESLLEMASRLGIESYLAQGALKVGQAIGYLLPARLSDWLVQRGISYALPSAGQNENFTKTSRLSSGGRPWALSTNTAM